MLGGQGAFDHKRVRSFVRAAHARHALSPPIAAFNRLSPIRSVEQLAQYDEH
jgi:hypothetical protein